MRGNDEQQLAVFSYVNPEQRFPPDHPLRPLRAMTDEALQQLQPVPQIEGSDVGVSLRAARPPSKKREGWGILISDAAKRGQPASPSSGFR